MANRDVHALSSNAFAVKPADTPEGAQGALSNQVIERTLCVQISGSLANLALAGPQAAMWKPVTGKEPDIFCPSMSADMDPTGVWLCGAVFVVRALICVLCVPFLMHVFPQRPSTPSGTASFGASRSSSTAPPSRAPSGPPSAASPRLRLRISGRSTRTRCCPSRTSTRHRWCTSTTPRCRCELLPCHVMLDLLVC